MTVCKHVSVPKGGVVSVIFGTVYSILLIYSFSYSHRLSVAANSANHSDVHLFR